MPRSRPSDLPLTADDIIVMAGDVGWDSGPAYASLARVELANAIFEYIEGFHNRRRRHSALGWASPLEFEAEHRNQATAPHKPLR